MRVTILAVGRLKSGPESELVARFAKRAEGTGRGVGVTGIALSEIAEARMARAAERRDAEAEQLCGRLAEGAYLFLLDEGGKSLSSEAFAERLRSLADGGCKEAAFAIGGPDGHGEALRQRADEVISFGAATWPHQLVRAMLLEQIYRATSLLAGHPYHRA